MRRTRVDEIDSAISLVGRRLRSVDSLLKHIEGASPCCAKMLPGWSRSSRIYG
jgi:hypothetical protein